MSEATEDETRRNIAKQFVRELCDCINLPNETSKLFSPVDNITPNESLQCRQPTAINIKKSNQFYNSLQANLTTNSCTTKSKCISQTLGGEKQATYSANWNSSVEQPGMFGEYSSANKQRKYIKKCPSCLENNDKDANWCLECGKALVSVEIRRCHSLKIDAEPYTPHFYSQSAPACHSIVYDSTQTFDNDMIQPEASNKIVSHSSFQQQEFSVSHSSSFDYQNLQFEDESQHYKNPAVFWRAPNEEEKKHESYMYAFDDLLYPNFAIHNPMFGFVIPSSNIVSHGAIYHQQQLCVNSLTDKVSKHHLKKKTKRRKTNPRRKSAKNAKSLQPRLDVIRREVHLDDGTEETSMFLSLPDELILRILSLLSLSEIAKLSCVCKQLSRVAADETLWSTIKLKQNKTLTDNILAKIASKHPTSLTITQCNSKTITDEGLRNLFRTTSESLQELDISGCSGGVLNGETVLLHVASRCKNISRLDVSWSNVSNIGVQSLSANLKKLMHLSINGCQSIRDESLIDLAQKHGDRLETLEVFGCFNVSPSAIHIVLELCTEIRKLNLGQCHKVNNTTASSIGKFLPNLQSLDVRGCKQLRDHSLREIVKNCLHLNTLVIANCPLITDQTFFALATYATKLKCLDACGCAKITNYGVDVLVKGCTSLETLDISSTKATWRSVTSIARYCRGTMTSLKLSFCHALTDECIQAVVVKCKKLKTLHLYGCKPLRNLGRLMDINPNLKIEKESLR